MVQDSAWSHNCIYHEVDITDMYDSGEFSKNVSDGSFKGIYPGCYIKKTKTIDGTTYTDHIDMIVSLDPYYSKFTGSSDYIYTHHVGIIPYYVLGKSVMNQSDTSKGGYASSYLRNITLSKYLTGYKNAYGASHFLTFGELISTEVNNSSPSALQESTGIASRWNWYETQITTMSEVQVYGSVAVSGTMDVGEACTQLEAFQYNHELQNFIHGAFWLRGVSSSTGFSVSGNRGYAYSNNSSISYYVRPLLLLY